MHRGRGRLLAMEVELVPVGDWCGVFWLVEAMQKCLHLTRSRGIAPVTLIKKCGGLAGDDDGSGLGLFGGEPTFRMWRR